MKNPSRHIGNRRRGYTLVELMVVVFVGSALLGVAVSTLGMVLRASKALNEHVHHVATMRRLAEQFRDDVHAAVDTRGLDDKHGVAGRQFVMALGDIVTYEIRRDAIDRIERADRVVRARETFTLPLGSVASTTAWRDADSSMVALVISPIVRESELRAAAVWRTTSIRIEAVLAKDHRFLKRQ